MTYKIHREASNTQQAVPRLAEKKSKLLGLKSVMIPVAYEEPSIPEPNPKATGIDQLLQVSILQPLVTLMHQSTNPQTIEGILVWAMINWPTVL